MKIIRIIVFLCLYIVLYNYNYNYNYLFAYDYDYENCYAAVKSATSRFFTIENRNYLNKNKNKILDQRPEMQTFVISPKGHFRIYFDTVGIHAVANVDMDMNGIYDYIDTVCEVFEYVYHIEINRFGFRPPRTDGYDAEDTLYNIYVKDQVYDACAYGYTTPIRSYNDNGNFNKWFSYITIDNNYSVLDSIEVNSKKLPLFATTGSNALKVTAAHEFFHAVQYGYGDDLKNGISTASIYEMTSVCMEILIYPDIYDYLIYVNNLLSNVSKYVFSDTKPEIGYRYGIFFYMLCKKYGEVFLLNYWEKVENGYICFEALEQLLLEKESSIADEWNEFCNWIYFTGSRAIPDKYFYFAFKCKELQPIINEEFDEKFIKSDYYLPYELVVVRIIFRSKSSLKTADTADFIITNLDTDEMIKQSYKQKQYFFYINTKQDNESIELFDNIWYKVYSTNGYLKYISFIYYGIQTNNITKAYPQPFSKSKHEYIYFPVPDYMNVGEKINLKIYNIELKEIYNIQSNIITDNKNKVVAFLANDIDLGIYIYKVYAFGNNKDEKTGKIIVKK